ncbi:MAG: hypothetical protein WC501_02050 [Candidatus Micrarchaeia archaeon]
MNKQMAMKVPNFQRIWKPMNRSLIISGMHIQLHLAQFEREITSEKKIRVLNAFEKKVDVLFDSLYRIKKLWEVFAGKFRFDLGSSKKCD